MSPSDETDFRAMVQELTDELELRRLVARVNYTTDSAGTPESYADLFTEDALIEDPDTGPGGKIAFDKTEPYDRGRLGIIDRQRRIQRAGPYGRGVDSVHCTAASLIEIDDDTATGRSIGLAYHHTAAEGNDKELVRIVRYFDTFRRTPDGWKIARRVITHGEIPLEGDPLGIP